MTTSLSRRHFVRAGATAALFAGGGDLELLGRLPAVSAAEASTAPGRVRFTSDIEPLVQFIEQTPRDKLLEQVAQRIKQGASYQQVLTALQLAGVRNIQPHPVGFEFHCVLVVNSALLASLASPDEHRWLPIFWALDEFKDSQERVGRSRPWVMPAPKGELTADKARPALDDAMNAWDEQAADAAISSLARTATQQEIYELMYLYGARDFHNIGHKPIYVANSQRALHCLGWQNAEPVLRSLTMGLLDTARGTKPASGDSPSLRPYLANQPRLKEFPAGWEHGRVDSAATVELLAALRQAPSHEIGATVVAMLRRGIGPQSIWDAVFVGAGELLARDRAIVGLHAVTSVNGLHYAYQATGNDETRKLLLLQGVSVVPYLREQSIARRKDKPLPEIEMDKLEPLDLKGSADQATAEILNDTSGDKPTASRKVLAYLHDRSPHELIDAARLLIFFKGRDPHDYKFSSALFEDYLSVSPAWRARYLASGPYFLHGSRDKENDLVKRTRAALA